MKKMEINVKGNPGTGNHFTEVHIGHVENYNPNVEKVVCNINVNESKRFDMDEEIRKVVGEFGFGHGGWIDGMRDEDLRKLARHFFELGKKSK